MWLESSPLFDHARAKLRDPHPRERPWLAVAAAAFFAATALGFAAAAILAPPLERTHAARTGILE